MDTDSDNEVQFIEPLSLPENYAKRTTEKGSEYSDNDEGDQNEDYVRFGERIAGIVSSIITVCLIFGLYSTHLIFVFIPWMEARRQEGSSSSDLSTVLLWLGLAVMTVFVAFGFWSFTAALITDNRVNGEKGMVTVKDSHEDLKDHSIKIIDSTDHNSNGSMNCVRRWCKKCSLEKPKRAHHCSVCNACILKMDHHCPWINNCVGYRNHGHYLRFLFYVVLAMLTGLLLMGARLFAFRGRYLYWGQKNGRFSIFWTDETVQMTFLVADLVGCGIISLLIGLLLAIQVTNISQGHTTIESLEISQCERDIRRYDANLKKDDHLQRKKLILFPYDLGLDANFRAVLGSNKWLWPFPLPIEWNPLLGSSGDGREFETRPDAFMNGIWPLPSKDPLIKERMRTGSLTDGGGFIVKNKNYNDK